VAGPSRESVIAKHTRIDSARFESLIYERVLSKLAISTLKYFGYSADSGGKSAWLFVEDAGEGRFDSGDANHQILAARWVSGLHTGTERLPGDIDVPIRTHDHYREILATARQKITDGMDHPALSDEHLDVLRAVLLQLELIDDSWEWIMSFCEQIPVTLMHGDFVDKNVRVSQYPSEGTLFVFDWESAARGVPAEDLAHVDAVAYFSAVQPIWPHFTGMLVRRLVRLGRVYRTLRLVDWASDNLSHAWPERSISKQLVYYEVWLREAFQAFVQDT
jgi:thiamine kinase-like enzyme